MRDAELRKKIMNGEINQNEEEESENKEETKCDTPELQRKTFLQRVGECCSGQCFTAFSNEVPAEETAEAVQSEQKEKPPPDLEYVVYHTSAEKTWLKRVIAIF